MLLNIIVGKQAVLTTYVSFLIIYDLSWLPGKQRTSYSSNTNSEKNVRPSNNHSKYCIKEDNNYHV